MSGHFLFFLYDADPQAGTLPAELVSSSQADNAGADNRYVVVGFQGFVFGLS